MRILGLIPARGGSKAIPGKNLRALAGKPLLQWTAEVAIASGVLDRIVLSTDDEDIAETGIELGVEVPFHRPALLAGEHAAMVDVVIHALEQLAEAAYLPDAVALLQPTSPLRRPEHIRQACELIGDADSVCSVVAVPKQLCPHYVMRIDEHGHLQHFLSDGALYTRRQDVPPAYSRDGTIYLVRREAVLQAQNLYGATSLPLLMDREDSLSIDDPADWLEAERRLAVRDPSPN